MAVEAADCINSSGLVNEWLQDLVTHRDINSRDDPNYYCSNPSELLTKCSPISFELGTGEQILGSILQKCLSAEFEIILVTCFWAKSQSQELISTFLKELSIRALSSHKTIRVRICLSSLSLFQKLFHTSNPDGQVYAPSTWASKFGLPDPSDLQGLDLRIKSVFLRPFSVMHPKFVIVDRKTAFVPSCNISWEKWFEGCIAVEGELVTRLFRFWQMFWARDETLPQLETRENCGAGSPIGRSSQTLTNLSTTPLLAQVQLPRKHITTILLPSPHHINPNFRPFQPSIPSHLPATPLNTFLLHILSCARHSIFIQSPNFTCWPLLSALLESLRNGVNIHLTTSSRLMVLEQLVTAGTVTEFCLFYLQRLYRKYLNRYKSKSVSDADFEALNTKPGTLAVSHYQPLPSEIRSRYHSEDDQEPVKSHLKLVIVDEEITVLGSGNCDRASWFTSQELGVAFFSRDVARAVREGVNEAMRGRKGPESIVGVDFQRP